METEYFKAATGILSYFKSNWGRLSENRKRHFAYRAWLVTGDEFWKQQLDNQIIRSDEDLKLMVKMTATERKRYGETRLRMVDLNKPNDAGKRQLYQQVPQIIYWGDYMNHWRYLTLKGNGGGYKLSGEQMSEMKTLLGSRLTFKLYPVWVIETNNDLRWLNNQRTGIRMKSWIKSDLFNESQLADRFNYVYALTHMLIGESRYYTKLVNNQRWVLPQLNSIVENEFEKLSLDLIAEIGVSYRLVSGNEKQIERKIIPAILAGLEANRGILKAGNEQIDLIEHRNILAVMLLADWKWGALRQR